MNAEQARQISFDNFEKVKNDKISIILDRIKESAENGEFEVIVKQSSLTPKEHRHLRELGYDVEFVFPESTDINERGRRIMKVIVATDLLIKWY